MLKFNHFWLRFPSAGTFSMNFNEDLIKISVELRFTEKRLNRSVKKLQQEATKKKSLLTQSISQGSKERAEIYADAVKRIEKDIKTTEILAARVSGMRLRLEQAKVTQAVTTVLANLTTQLQSDESLALPHIQSVMERFESATENLEVSEGVMAKSLSKATQTYDSPDDVDDLIAEIADENDLELTALLPSVAAKVASAAPSKQPIASHSMVAKRSVAI
jgi:division protein CdvB (Snf7/Vps24/ESCRT-III family)